MTRSVLFVCDPLGGFKTYKDTTFAMMRECQRQGIEIHTAELHELRTRADREGSRLEVLPTGFASISRRRRPGGLRTLRNGSRQARLI